MKRIKAILRDWIPPVLERKLSLIKTIVDYQKMKPLISSNNTFKDIHKGKRCFILGSGPSIKLQDLKPLKEEIVFSLNNFFVHPDFHEIMSGEQPKYHLVAPTHPPQKRHEWVDWLSKMAECVPKTTTMIFGETKYIDSINNIIKKENLFAENKVKWYFPRVNTNIIFENFNRRYFDVSFPIMAANTVSVYALIWAIFMGFERIYLLGLDHNYFSYKDESESRFYQNAIHQQDEQKRFSALVKCSTNRHALTATGLIFRQYELLKHNTESKIFNLSSTSICDVFDFDNLAEVLL